MPIIIRAVGHLNDQVTHSAAGKGRRKAALRDKRVCSETNYKCFHSLHRLKQWDTTVPGVHVKFHWF